jgi:transposase
MIFTRLYNLSFKITQKRVIFAFLNYKRTKVMGRKVKTLKNHTTEEVEAIFASNENNLTGVKLYAVLQLTKGFSSRKLTEFYHTSFKQICNWADRFDKEGIDGLRLKSGRGRHCQLSEDQQYQLQGDLLKNPHVFGYNTATWSGPLVQSHIKKKYNIDYKLATVYKLMHKLGFSFQRAKSFYPERDEAKRQAFREDIKKTQLLRKSS